ncbi:malonyl-[acyl-carrier protein] O-methyltransferase [Clostridium polyendosporum]|uniref:Malonyl-[acyl-carrier protein] O-methyltransferase n=1 Tax=Clostridium polyendosporum TaxID=69208 RepID=A0A919S2T3_9CLOT|nr:malonyl-ACP O-methyltransferase BioC [Clostridium polyendosporum]GIM30697.1 malonyl-[acyl-carrier protein] O-methyltransferase [Clostridium polyendosporum]
MRVIDKEKLKRRFSRNIKNYDKYANVQKRMGDILVDYIKNDRSHIKNILEIGCGTGYVTQRLINYFPDAQITAVDIAPGMIEYVKSIIQCDRVNFICEDIEEMKLKDKFDLIISNATFQWFNNLEKTTNQLIELLDKNGILCFSTFGENTFKELNEAFSKAKDMLKINESISPGQSFYSLNQLQDICNNIITTNNVNDMEISSLESYEYEYFNCCIDFLYSIKKIGANNSQKDGNITPPDFIEKVIEIYDKDYLENDRVVATYHTLYFYIKYKDM